MWKKLITMFICIVSVFTFGYVYLCNDFLPILHAQSAPAFELPKGSKVVLGKYNNKEIVWDIGNNTSDYVLMSSKSIKDMPTYNSSIPVTTTPQSGIDRENYCLKFSSNQITFCPTTSLKNEIAKINLNTNENYIITRVPFLPSIAEIYNSGSLGLTVHDRAYKKSVAYWLSGAVLLQIGRAHV